MLVGNKRKCELRRGMLCRDNTQIASLLVQSPKMKVNQLPSFISSYLTWAISLGVQWTRSLSVEAWPAFILNP